MIALAASAGGVEALTEVISRLPADLPAAVLVVLHIAPIGPSVLPSILSRHSRLPARNPADGERLRAGHVYVAPPDRHLVVLDNRAHLVVGPRENGNRPAADPLFRSVARAFGPRAAGVVLSGALDDGTVGLAAIKDAGGLTVAQDPEEATFPGMPSHAIAFVRPDHVAKLADIPAILVEFAERVEKMPPEPSTSRAAETVAVSDPLSPLTCTECGGTLFVASESPLRFRCRVGHAFSPESLLVGKQDAVEAALWAAIVALEERADLTRRLLRRVGDTGSRRGRRYRADIELIEDRVAILKDLAGQMVIPVATVPEDFDVDD